MNEQEEGFDFIKEKIKEKPINKRKLLRKTIITTSLGILFGLVACFTFILLQPIISEKLYPEEGPSIVVIPEEEDEILPEDMLLEEPVEEVPVEPAPIIQKPGLSIKDYENLYGELENVAKEASKSIVTVTSVETDVDWFQNPYDTENKASGVIVANNGREYIIIVDEKLIERTDHIIVTFDDGEQVTGTIGNVNANTGLLAISVLVNDVPKETKEKIELAKLGSSSHNSILANPIIAIGSPVGYTGSLAYGMITAVEETVKVVDSAYSLISTDIIGSNTASGVIINLDGEVIGIVRSRLNESDKSTILSGWGISQLKTTIEKLSNGLEFAYVGIYGTDIPESVRIQRGLPIGAYVAELEMDSPAMNGGIQSGDIITMIGEEEITSYQEYIEVIDTLIPEETVEFTFMRFSREEYIETKRNVVIGKVE